MNWSRIRTKTLIVIGVSMVCGSIGGAALGFYAFHNYGQRLVVLQGASLFMTAVFYGMWWILDAIRCSLSQKALYSGDYVAAEKHLGKVLLLRRKAEAIRQVYGLVRPERDRSRPLAARGKSRHGIRPSLHPGGLRCDSITYSRYAPESRLVRRAQERSRCSRDFHHGLLGLVPGGTVSPLQRP